MNAQEKHTLRKIIESASNPCSPGAAYDKDLQPIKVDQLVSGTPNYRLLDDPLYKAGYKYAAENFTKYLEALLLEGTAKDQVRFCGKPKK